jgi:nitroreductase
MNVFEVVEKRRSVRCYKKTPVENEKVLRILEAARFGPSAANRQPCHFIVVTNPEVRKSLSKAYSADWFLQAPAVIVCCANPKEAWRRWDREEYWKVDAAIAMQNLILTATELGLGTCWIGAFKEKEVKKALNIPKNIRVVAMTPLGYPGETKTVATERKPLTEIVHYEKW